MAQTNDQVWFVTGANKGIGAAITKAALDKGYKVVATARQTEGMQQALGDSQKLLITSLDITNEEQVHASVNAALEQFGRIDVLVNNAGFGQLGFFEETSEEQIRGQIETNIFGTMKLTRAVLPAMRKQGSGTVVVISSAMGIASLQGGSIYSASKFALEGWAEGLSHELKPFGIRCLIVEPGPFRTDFVNEHTSAKFSDIEIEDYNPQRNAMRDFYFAGHAKQPGDPVKLAKALIKVANDSRPPLRWIAGKGLVGFAHRVLEGRLAQYDAWCEVSDSTNFE